MRRGSRAAFRRSLGIIGLLTLLLLAYAYARVWRPSRTLFPLQGVDVSHHQGRIDWARVRRAGADFAYIKATEGGDHRDSHFAANWRGARAAGLRTGAYHFFTLCRPGAEQAANFTATVPAAPDALPPVIDVEFGGNCGKHPSRAAVLAELAATLHGIEAHSRKPAILYVTGNSTRPTRSACRCHGRSGCAAFSSRPAMARATGRSGRYRTCIMSTAFRAGSTGTWPEDETRKDRSWLNRRTSATWPARS